MASQQQPRPMFRFASMIRPAPIAQPPAPAPPTPAPQPLFRPAVAAPIRPPASTTTTTTATTVITTQPTQPQVPTPQTPAAALPPVVARPLTPPQAQPQPTALIPRSPILSPQPQPVAAASPRSIPTAPAPRSPAMAPAPVTAPTPVVVSPPKVPPPRSPPVAATVPRSSINNVTASVPQSPFKTAPTSTPYSSLPPSPKTKLADSIQNLITQSSSSPPKAPSPSQKVIQPNLVKAPTYSPQVKPAAISHPPSPLKLPPPQLDLESNKIPPQVEQKTVVVQETTTRTNNINGHHHVPHVTRNGRIEENGKREVLKKDKGVHPQKKVSNSEDFGTSVLTLAGENRGAIMELSPSRNNHNGPQQSLHKKLASPKAWTSSEDESGSESGKAKKRDNKMSNNKNQLPMTAFMNSNVQGVNNSILHNASCTHHDPGVHLVFSRKSNGHGFHIKGSPKS